MTKTQATAEIFWTAFRVLPHQEQAKVLQHILQDKKLRQTLVQLDRRKEITRPVPEFRKRGMTARQLVLRLKNLA